MPVVAMPCAHTAAKCRVAESWTYNTDRTLDEHTDFRGNTWNTDWSTCCAGRVEAQYSPPPSGSSYPKPGVKTQYDGAGNVVYVRSVSLSQSSETIYSQTTTRYDARHRPTARTVWLVEQNIATDETHPPIAGGGEMGDPALEISGVKQGLTTRWLYDEDLRDGVGLDSAGGVEVDELDGVGSFYVKLADLLDELEADLNSGSPFFDTGCVGSAVVTINPEEEISVSIQDAAGRTVISGVIAQDGTPITWSTVKHDAVVTIGGYGDVVETARIDALNHQSKSRSDAAGRTIESVDALSNVTSMQYDANGNLLRVRDPNSVGWDAGTALGTFNGYDYQNRLVARIDTEGVFWFSVKWKHRLAG